MPAKPVANRPTQEHLSHVLDPLGVLGMQLLDLEEIRRRRLPKAAARVVLQHSRMPEDGELVSHRGIVGRMDRSTSIVTTSG